MQKNVYGSKFQFWWFWFFVVNQFILPDISTAVVFFLIRIVGGGVQTGSTRHVGNWMAYGTCPGWLWWWRIWWNEDWQGKPAPAPLCPPQIPLHQSRVWTWAAVVGSQRLTAWAMALPYCCSLLRNYLGWPTLNFRVLMLDDISVLDFDWNLSLVCKLSLLCQIVKLCNFFLHIFSLLTSVH
jgi:hypothetical protein